MTTIYDHDRSIAIRASIHTLRSVARNLRDQAEETRHSFFEDADPTMPRIAPDLQGTGLGASLRSYREIADRLDMDADSMEDHYLELLEADPSPLPSVAPTRSGGPNA